MTTVCETIARLMAKGFSATAAKARARVIHDKIARLEGKPIKVHKTDDFIRKRMFDPEDCQPGTFRTIDLPGTDDKAVICKKRGETTTSIQARLTPRKKKGGK